MKFNLRRYTEGKLEQEEEEEDEGEEEDAAGLDSGTPWEDFEIGSEEDLRLAKEEREVPNVITVGAHMAYEAAVKAAAAARKLDKKCAAAVPPDNTDGLKRDLNWRSKLRYEMRTVVGRCKPKPMTPVLKPVFRPVFKPVFKPVLKPVLKAVSKPVLKPVL